MNTASMSNGIDTAEWLDAKRLIADRQRLHGHPELAFEESQTADFVADRLAKVGWSVRRNVGKTGVVATMRGHREGRRVLARADMDALPISEELSTPYTSKVPGVSHACGHDGHTAALLGVGEGLAANRDLWPGEVVLMFQPAEETLEGCKAMLADGLLADGDPDAAIALHLWNYLPLGKIGVRAGPSHAAVDEFTLEIVGTGGHGGMPHQGVDAIVVAAYTLVALQTMASREASPFFPLVLSVGKIDGGTAHNALADRVTMSGTVRMLDEAQRVDVHRRLEAMVDGIATSMRAKASVSIRSGAPSLVSDESIAAVLEAAAKEVVGESNVVSHSPVMGGEDFSYLGSETRIGYFVVGSQQPSGAQHALHHHRSFDFQEEALLVGARVMLGAILRLLAGTSNGERDVPQSD